MNAHAELLVVVSDLWVGKQHPLPFLLQNRVTFSHYTSSLHLQNEGCVCVYSKFLQLSLGQNERTC